MQLPPVHQPPDISGNPFTNLRCWLPKYIVVKTAIRLFEPLKTNT